jgi:hypothetical protein
MAPYPRHRGRVARALDSTEHELWPQLATPRRAAPSSDLIAAYPNAPDPAAPDPTALMRDASERIDLLDETLIHILAIDGVPDTLARKAQQGVEIRILISEPDNPWVNPVEGIRRRSDLDLDDEQDHHQQLETEAKQDQWLQANQRAQHLLAPLLDHPGIEIRAYLCPRYHTILRLDQQMLVTVNLWAHDTVQAPLLHLQRNTPEGIFDRFAEHYDRLWQDASIPIEPEPDADAHQPQPASHKPPRLGQPRPDNDTTPPPTDPRRPHPCPRADPGPDATTTLATTTAKPAHRHITRSHVPAFALLHRACSVPGTACIRERACYWAQEKSGVGRPAPDPDECFVANAITRRAPT